MNFVPVPIFPGTDEKMQAFRSIVFMPANIATFAYKQTVNGLFPQEGSELKPWRDNAAIYGEEPFSYTIIVPGAAISLRYREVQGDAGKIVADVENIRELEAAGYPRAAIQFYNERVIASKGNDPEFARVPLLQRVTYSRQHAGNLNLVATSSTPVHWPVAIPTGDGHTPSTINPDVAFRFNQQTGWQEAFSVNEYNREFPIVKAPAPSSTGRLTDGELVTVVSSIVTSPLTIEKKAAAIRRAVA